MRALLLVCLAGCTEPREAHRDGSLLVDLSHTSGVAERLLGHHKRGRSCAPGDFDGNGTLDVAVASPQDPLILLANDGRGRFEPHLLAGYGTTWWSLAAADFDDDGDPDLYAGAGGNETEEFDRFYLNRDGRLERQPLDAPVAGATAGDGVPVPGATAGVRWGDLDLDGNLDLFLSTYILEPRQYDDVLDPLPQGRDRVLLGDGDGGFVEATGLGLDEREPSINNTLLDIDNDGDLDVYMNVIGGWNRLYRNELQERGTLHFTDITRQWGPTIGTRLVDPIVKAFSSAAADLNNDGWQDLIVWHRGPTNKKHPMDRHLIWLNAAGQSFVEVGELTGLPARWHECEDLEQGVMGSQVADVDLDGLLDIFIGNGGPSGGCANQLWLADGLEPHETRFYGTLMVPTYRDVSDWIDHPVPGTESEVPFPYRTHGACFADYDGDARPELLWVNGGPGWAPDTVREPNRYFDVRPTQGWHFLTIRPVGDGVSVPLDATGTRVRARVRRSTDGAEWEVHRTLFGGSGFVAHNGPDLFIGLADADSVLELELTWPDGLVEQVDVPGLDRRLVVER